MASFQSLPQNSFFSFGADVTSLIASYLTSNEVNKLMRSGSELNAIISSDEGLWKALCASELGLFHNLSFYDYVKKKLTSTGLSWKSTYLDWRRDLARYNCDEIKRVKVFWDRLEACLASMGLACDSILKPGVSQECIKTEELIFDSRIPQIVSLMYRFHNGQKHRQIGIFGGYAKYGAYVDMIFYSLDECVSFDGEIFALTIDEFCSGSFMTRNVEPYYSNRAVMFAGSNNRVLFAGDDGTLCLSIGRRSKYAIYCHSPPANARASPILDWLEDYVDCLEAGLYRLEFADMNQTSNSLIALYPIPRHISPTTSAASMRVLQESSHLRSVAITNGVEIRAAAIFAPEESACNHLTFVYTLRMRLLADHPSRPPNLTHCQLHMRHWEITDPGKEYPDRVDGEGVIGMFPVLRASTISSEATYQQGWFCYQSCSSVLTPLGGKMRGSITFKAFNGNLELSPFDAEVAEFAFEIPKYIR